MFKSLEKVNYQNTLLLYLKLYAQELLTASQSL